MEKAGIEKEAAAKEALRQPFSHLDRGGTSMENWNKRVKRTCVGVLLLAILLRLGGSGPMAAPEAESAAAFFIPADWARGPAWRGDGVACGYHPQGNTAYHCIYLPHSSLRRGAPVL